MLQTMQSFQTNFELDFLFLRIVALFFVSYVCRAVR